MNSTETGHLNRIYFAYGSNMDPVQMEYRCPGSVPIGIGTLDGWEFIINIRGVATIARRENSVVIGVLWSISEEHENTLDRYEGVADDFYYKDTVTLKTGSGTSDALVYIEPVIDHGPPREGYLEKILTGARHFKLTESYIAELEKWAV
jgi:gamma-glutamylcyclotransferase (GGCT)/AIG2-like uncharacterized protein YtfP